MADDAAQRHLEQFGQRVRKLRRDRDLTQEQLAHLAGLHRTIVGFVERGEREIGIAKLWPLAEALNVRIGVLFES